MGDPVRIDAGAGERCERDDFREKEGSSERGQGDLATLCVRGLRKGTKKGGKGSSPNGPTEREGGTHKI